jgi:hypothetical protein
VPSPSANSASNTMRVASTVRMDLKAAGLEGSVVVAAVKPEGTVEPSYMAAVRAAHREQGGAGNKVRMISSLAIAESLIDKNRALNPKPSIWRKLGNSQVAYDYKGGGGNLVETYQRRWWPKFGRSCGRPKIPKQRP